MSSSEPGINEQIRIRIARHTGTNVRTEFYTVSSRKGVTQDGELGCRVKIGRWIGFDGQWELNLLTRSSPEDSVE